MLEAEAGKLTQAMGDTLRAWLTQIECDDLFPALTELGVKAPPDIQWLSEAHVETLMAQLRPVQQGKFKNAAAQVAQESSSAVVPVTSAVPEWSSPPATGAVGAFAELQQNKVPPLMSRVVTLGGRQVPLVAVTGGAVAVVLLLLLVVAIVPSSWSY